jgi:hypothetical protein
LALTVGAGVCSDAPVSAAVCWGNVDVGVGFSLDISVAVGATEPGTMIRPLGLGEGKGGGVDVTAADEQAESATATRRPARPRKVALDFRGRPDRKGPMRSQTTP